jgi:hypothetical protein
MWIKLILGVRSHRRVPRLVRCVWRSIKSEPFLLPELMYRLFNFSRTPLPGCDAFSAIAPHALQTTLIVDDFYYSIDIFAPPNGGDAHPEPLSVVDIEGRIRAAVEDAKSRKDGGERPPMVGILTGDERDTWTTVSCMSLWILKLSCRTEKRSFTSHLRIETTSTPSPHP